jgi:hypothetical protein
MSATRSKYRVGELRPSQVLFTYGIGAIVDLPYISTMVMGLDDWENPYPVMVGEERLLQAVRAMLGPQVARLLTPPEGRNRSEGYRRPLMRVPPSVSRSRPFRAGCSARAVAPWHHSTPGCFN